MINFWNLERGGTKKERAAKKRRLKKLNALPGSYESAKVGRRRGLKVKPVYRNLGAKHYKGDL